MNLAWDMRSTAAAETHEYALKWLAFQKRWVEQMPIVPLYTSVYFDYYTSKLQDYFVAQYMSWTLSIPYSWLGEPLEVETELIPIPALVPIETEGLPF